MSPSFRRFAAGCSLLTALAGLIFTVTFAIYVREAERWAAWVSQLALLGGGLVVIPVIVALYFTFSDAEPQFALVALIVAVAGALGAAIHGAFDISILANTPPPGRGPEVPNYVDPRGFLTFAAAGLALLLFGWLMLRGGGFPRQLPGLALVGGVLLLGIYVGRLTLVDPETNVIRLSALASGLIVLPAFYFLLGRALWRGLPPRTGPPPAPGP